MTAPSCIPARIRVGTRGSALALAQAHRVAELLTARNAGLHVEIIAIDTQGDRDKTTSLTVIGGCGVFTSAVQAELLAGTVDIAVHSAKDLPARSPDGLEIVAIPEREDARDVIVSRHGTGIAGLPPAPRIGTSSRRRAMEILALRPDARIVDLRGNIDTRLRKSETPEYDAIVLAAAGLGRLGWLDRVTEWLELDRFVPAPGQGALAIEARVDDAGVIAAVQAIDDPEASLAVRAERSFLGAVGAGCTVPLGAHIRREHGEWVLRAVYGEDAGKAARLVRRLDPRRLLDDAASAARELLDGGTVRARTPRVLVTRAASQAAPLSAALVAAGMAPMEYPVIRIDPPADVSGIDGGVAGLLAGDFDWVVFTSANGVEGLASRMDALGVNGSAVSGVRTAAVGRATAAALARRGWPVSFMSAEATGASLSDELAGHLTPGSRVLHPRGDLARDEVITRLEAAGAIVTPAVAYRTVPEDRPNPHDDAVRRGDVDAVTFTSPSGVRNLAARIGGLASIAGARIVCVGPVTAEEARAHGLMVHAIADDASVDGLVAAVRAAMLESAIEPEVAAVAGAGAGRVARGECPGERM